MQSEVAPGDVFPAIFDRKNSNVNSGKAVMIAEPVIDSLKRMRMQIDSTLQDKSATTPDQTPQLKRYGCPVDDVSPDVSPDARGPKIRQKLQTAEQIAVVRRTKNQRATPPHDAKTLV